MLKRLVILACLAGFLFGWPCVAENQQRSSHAANHVASQNNQLAPPTHVIIDPPIPPPSGQSKPADQSNESQEKLLPRFMRPEWVIVYVTVAYSLITLFMWLTIKRQANIMEDQAKDARDSSTAAAVTTEETLKVIREQATQLERQVKASHDGLRAWIGIELRENVPAMALSMINQISNLLVPQPPRFVWKIKNYGQTPAFITGMGADHVYAREADLGTMIQPKMRPIIDFIGAGREKENPLVIDDATYRDVLARLKFWRIVIKVEYLDAFDKERMHETVVSFHYYVPKEATDPLSAGFFQEHDPRTNYNT
jgi:hypothetical protein